MHQLQFIDPSALKHNRKADPSTNQAIQHLQTQAHKALQVQPISITDFPRLPPSGNPREYRSWGTYWWPDPDKPDGLPWIRRDGEQHPDALGNREQMSAMADAVETLALAAYITDESSFGEHAAELLRVFFLDEAKGMLPHLQYAQAIPGRNDGRAIGLIDTHRLVDLPDHIHLLRETGHLPDDHYDGLKTWFDEYRNWFATSEHGKEECNKENNHGTYYDMQLACFAHFAGNAQQAHEAIQRALFERLPTQLDEDGSQPHELARTRSYDYSCMNLMGFLRIAWFARLFDIDVKDRSSETNRLLRCAVDWFEPHVSRMPGSWTHQQITPIDLTKLAKLFFLAEYVLGEPRYGEYSRRTAALADTDSLRLCWSTT